MTVYWYRLIWLGIGILLAGLLLGKFGLQLAHSRPSEKTAVLLTKHITRITELESVRQTNLRHVALIGVADQVHDLAAPFVDNGQIKLVRRYPNPETYLAEAPKDYFPQLPEGLTIQLFELPLSPDLAEQVLSQLIDEAAFMDVFVEHTSLAWLSYAPGQVMLAGTCADIVQLAEGIIGLGEPDVVDLAFTVEPLACADNLQFRLYPITDTESVEMRVDFINKTSDVVAAQPNRFMVGSPSEDYIAGSPVGPLLSEAQPWSTKVQGGTGENVRILIFDTVPFAITPGQTIQENYQGVPITVTYPHPLPADLPTNGQSIASHGTFVASGAMDITPDAQYYLVKVLNEVGFGDEFTFYQAASQMITETLAVSHTLAGVVMNYSFVLEISPTLPSPAMSAFMTAVDNLNITQVAAAGNDSALLTTPAPMLFPAQHDAVLGVTAVNWNASALACFANEGEIAIWGGGIGRGSNSCDFATIVAQCLDQSHPEYCVTGWDPSSSTNYAYGLGTSFAAPLVSGLAAQDIAATTTTLGNWPSPNLVRATIYSRVTHNPAPHSIEIGAIGNPYLVTVNLYLPFLARD